MTMSMDGGVAPIKSSLSLLRLQSEVDRIWRETGEGLPKLVPLEDGDLVHEVHQFSERANWLVPGKVLLGKYPGQIPADLPADPHRQLARDRILDIVLRGGVTDLFCLQAELPPQDDQSRWQPPADDKDNGDFYNGFRAYRGDAEAAVAGAATTTTAAPASTLAAGPAMDGSIATDLRVDGDEGTESGGPRKDVAGVRESGETGLAFHHFPIPDLSPAENTEFLAGLVDQLESLVAVGKVPFIHCWAGRGRTGLVASCLLGRLYPELSAEQALSRVDAYYRTRGTVAIGKTCRVSPETPEQEEQARLFFKDVLKR
eukprot:g11141.t1